MTLNLLKKIDAQPLAQQPSTAPNEAVADANYDEIIAQLNSSGIKTTTIRTDRGEANFGDYGAALSPEMQAMILNSYDCEEDYILQQELAGLYRNDNSLSFAQFTGACKNMGYEVKYESIKSSMIPDNKGSKGIQSNVEEHHLAVYTITDPETGASIKIVDSNGNGEIEVEELFMNQILQEVSVNIDTANFGKSIGVTVSFDDPTAIGGITSIVMDENILDPEVQSNKKKITRMEFDLMVKERTQEILSNNENKTQKQAEVEAILDISRDYCVDGMEDYLGTYGLKF